MAETFSKIALASLRLLKVKASGDDLKPAEAEDARIHANDILEQWNLQKLMQPSLQTISQAVTASDGSYTFGSGGDNSTRPVRIRNAYIRDSNGIDCDLEPLMSDQYDAISDKTLTGVPSYYFIDNAYPLATIQLYPVPSAAYTLYLKAWGVLSSISAVTSSVDLAPGYIRALKSNLAVSIAPEYKLHDSYGEVKQRAMEDLAFIKRVNLKDRMVMSHPEHNALGRSGSARSFFNL